MEWSELIKIPKWASVSDVGLDLIEIEEDFYKITENQYCFSVPYNSVSLEEAPSGPFITAFLWACSEGAAKRMYLNEIESDDGVSVLPPPEILPSPDKKSYREILERLKGLGCKAVMEHAGFELFLMELLSTELLNRKWHLIFLEKKSMTTKKLHMRFNGIYRIGVTHKASRCQWCDSEFNGTRILRSHDRRNSGF